MGRIKEGDIFAIQDNGFGYYYCIRCRGNDMSFFDANTAEIESADEIIKKKSFLRMWVVDPSIKRDGWSKIGSVELRERLSDYAKYKHTPVGAPPLLYNPETGQSIPCDDADLEGLETLTFWDAEYHIKPLLRYHFHREETPFRSLITAKL